MPGGHLETLGNFTLHFGLKYEIIYQLNAIEYLFVFFQVKEHKQILNCIKLVNYFIFQIKMQGKTTQSFQMPTRHKEICAFRNTKRKIYKTNAAV